MSRFSLLILCVAALPSAEACADWVKIERVRQVQCATDRVGTWQIHYLQAGVIKAQSAPLEPDVVMFREKNIGGSEWHESKARALCLALKKAMADGTSLEAEIDATGHLLNIRL